MIDTKTVKRMMRKPKASPSVPDWRLGAWSSGTRRLFAPTGDHEARAICQNLIDQVAAHRHLREARICLLFEMGKGANADGLVSLGRAKEAAAADSSTP